MTTPNTEWTRLKRVTVIKGGAGFPHDEQGLRHHELPFFKVGSLESAGQDRELVSAENSISRETAKRLGAYIFKPGTVVFAKVGAALMLNRYRQLRNEACLDNNMMGLEPYEDRLLPRFLMYAMSIKDLALIANPGAVPSVNGAQIAEESIWCPPLGHQARIVQFLDEQATRIDALVAEKERLVGTVREYEQAELSQILTQGLNKHSLISTGRAFVTRAPAHWRVTAFKRALIGLGQGWSPQCEGRPAEAHEWGVLKVGCVNGTTFNANENKALPPSLEPDLTCVLQRGDVLVSRANTRELVGLAALVEDEHPNLLMCDKLYRLRLRTDWVTPEFSVLLLRSDAARRQIELGASGASPSMQNISQDVIRELLVALPPIAEQTEIVSKARQIRESCNMLVGHCTEHIDRLREYRLSLISAAVTGQMEVGALKAAA